MKTIFADRGKTFDLSAGQDLDVVSVVLTVVIAAAIAMVGLVVLDSTNQSADFTEGSTFDNSSDSLLSGIETIYGMIDVVFIALFLAIIVGALLFVQSRR